MTSFVATKSEAEAIDAHIMAIAYQTKVNFMALAKLAAEAIEKKVYAQFGYIDEVGYFNERVQIPYRTLRRWLQANSGVERLPEEDQKEARNKLGRLGVHKAASLGPVLGRPDVDWRKEVEFAERANMTAVQARASDITGAKPRGMPLVPGERFYNFVLNHVPPNCQDEVKAVFEALRKHTGTQNYVALFMIMVDLTRRDLADQGVEA